MALTTTLRTYFASAFTGKYYEQAEAAFDALKAMVTDPKTRFFHEEVPLAEDVTIKGVEVVSGKFQQQFPKLTVVFVDKKELVDKDGTLAFLNDHYQSIFWIFKKSELFVLTLGITTGGAPLTAEMIRSQMKSSRVLKHLFVHEFVHYVQRNRFAAVLLPLSTLLESTPYQQRWDEIEAWNVEMFSRFLTKVPQAVKAEIVTDINRFEIAFTKFIVEHYKRGSGFYMKMTELERGRFIRESFDLLRKKMAVTTQGS